MSDNNNIKDKKNDYGYDNKSCLHNHPSIREKFKHWVLNKHKIIEQMEREEMLKKNKNSKINDRENKNNDKKVDVSNVSGGALSIEEQNGKYNVVSTKVLDSFDTKEAAQEEINNRAEASWNHHHGFSEMHNFDRYKLKFPKLIKKF